MNTYSKSNQTPSRLVQIPNVGITNISPTIKASQNGPIITPLLSHFDKINIQKMSNKPPESLLTNVMKRLTTLEGHLEKSKKKLKQALHVIKEKDTEINKLKTEIALLLEERPQAMKSSFATKKDVEGLENKTDKLQTRVSAIENFMCIDPLYWYRTNQKLEDDQYCQYNVLPSSQEVDIDSVIKQINDLNFEAGEIHVCQNTETGAIFQGCDSMDLTFYANGMYLEGSSFRDYSDITVQLFLQDILDGYFPEELQRNFPRGVIFNVSDKRNEIHHEVIDKKEPFSGRGWKLDNSVDKIYPKETFTAKNRLSILHDIATINKRDVTERLTQENDIDICKNVEKTLYKSDCSELLMLDRYDRYRTSFSGFGEDCKHEELRERSILLPNVTTKNGQVCKKYRKIQSETKSNAKDLCHKKSNIKFLNTKEIHDTSESFIQLKIRSLKDKDIFILTINVNDTVGKLRSYLPDEFKDCRILYYDGHKRVYLTDNSKTLKDCGIFENTVLFLSKAKVLGII